MSEPKTPATEAIPRGGAPGYLRIATEEAFASSGLFDLYRKLLASRTLDDPGFASLWGFYLGSKSPRATAHHRADPGPGRTSAAGHGRNRHRHADPVAHLPRRPGVRCCHGRRGRARRQRPARGRRRESSGPLCRARRRGAAGPRGRREGDRAWRAPAGPQGRDTQLAHAQRVPGRPEVLADLRGLRGARRAGLPAPEHPVEGDDRAVRRGRTRRRDLWLWRRDRPASAQDHRGRRLRPLPGPAHRRRPLRRGAAVLALPPRLHASRDDRLRALPVHEAAAAKTERLPARERLRYEQRCGLGTGDHVLPFSARRRPRDVRDGLPVPVRPRRGPGERQPAADRGGKEAVLPGQRRARVRSARREARAG